MCCLSDKKGQSSSQGKNWRSRARQHPRRKHLTGAVTDAVDADALRRDDLLSDTDKLATCA